jgi:hypothetical protein
MPSAPYTEDMAKESEKGRTQDRHTSGYMVRLEEEYREALRLWQKKQKKATRVEPDMVDGVRIALDDFLSREGCDGPLKSPRHSR